MSKGQVKTYDASRGLGIIIDSESKCELTVYANYTDLKAGESFRQVFLDNKPAVYGEVCLVFTKKARSYDGKAVDRICNDLSQAQMKFITRPGSTAATAQGQAAAQLCPTCW